MIRRAVHGLAAAMGFEIRRRVLVDPVLQLLYVLRFYGIDTVLDVGANRGQFASQLRRAGYNGHICSFEPDPRSYGLLVARMRGDSSWKGINAAVGAAGEGEVRLNISTDFVSSSVLERTEAYRDAVPQSATSRVIQVKTISLDEMSHLHDQRYLALKVDTQGYEDKVLDGAEELLKSLVVLQLEMALEPMYEGGATIHSLLPRVRALGFMLHSMTQGYIDPATRRLLDVDAIFVRKPTHSRL